MNFKDLNIDIRTIEILKKHGITEPTLIQEKCILPIMENTDIIAESGTGTGKTLGFLLPVMQKINASSKDAEVLILTPTRELAIQIAEEAEKLNFNGNYGILLCYGGKDIQRQIKKLNKGIQLIIATPGRLLDYIERGAVSLSKIKSFILDEADQMLLMGFKNEVEKIMNSCPKKKQVLCFSATMNSQVKKLAYRYMQNPAVISVKEEPVDINAIEQYVVKTTDREKRNLFCRILDEDNPFMAIIFCRTKRRADDLEEVLCSRKYNCEKIHSDVPQNKRERIMKNFRNAKIQFLIATDVASRGLDITGVTHIYNYDIPESPEVYIHRIGRTGRAGETGKACTIIDPKDEKMLSEIEKEIGFAIPLREI